MLIKYLKKNGNVIDKQMAVRNTPHQENLSFLKSNPKMNTSIRREVREYIDGFLKNIANNQDSYINSGNVATKVCAFLNLPQDKFHHGLVGSVLLDEFEMADSSIYGLNSNLTVIASKGEDQTWFDYFRSSPYLCVNSPRLEK